MKDIIISSKRQKREITSFLVCFIIAFALNVYAIIKYEGKWSELFWSLGFVVATAVALYLLWVVARLIFAGIKSLFHRNKK